ncbi:MAG: DUF3108 domain-containing protein [Bacteroidales bacterium]
MRKLLATIVLFLFTYNVFGQCHIKNTTFISGEKLKYKVYYNLQFIWLEVADIEFSVSTISYMGRNCLKLSSIWKTRPKYDWLMHVDDKYSVVLNYDSIIPYEYNQNLTEGKHKSDIKYIYNQHKNLIYAWIDSRGKPKKFDSIPVNRCIFDLITSIYYIRNLNYQAYSSNQKIPYSAILGDKINKLEITYAGKELVKMNNDKKVNCYKIKPSIATTEMFKGGKDKFTAWFTDDKNQLPVMAEAELFLGSVKLIISSYEGLKYPALY